MAISTSGMAGTGESGSVELETILVCHRIEGTVGTLVTRDWLEQVVGTRPFGGEIRHLLSIGRDGERAVKQAREQLVPEDGCDRRAPHIHFSPAVACGPEDSSSGQFRLVNG